MARKIEIELVGDSRKLKQELGDSETAIGKLRGGMSGLAKTALIAGGAAGIGALVIGAGKAISAAKDLGESTNAVRVVFGKASTKVLDFSKDAAKMGLSMREANELITPVGAALQNAGYSADQAATASVNLTKRAADMASVFNTSVPEALEAIQAGLRGESDPLEKFGVGLGEAALQAQASAMGIKTAVSEMDNHTKAQVRMAAILEQTNKLQGDFANTSDGLANQQRILSAEFENATAKLGQELLPAAVKVMSFLTGTGIPALQELSKWISEHVAPAIRNDLVPQLQAFYSWFKDKIIPILVSFGGWVQENFPGIKKEIVDAFHDIGGAMDGVRDVMHDINTNKGPSLLTIMDTIGIDSGKLKSKLHTGWHEGLLEILSDTGLLDKEWSDLKDGIELATKAVKEFKAAMDKFKGPSGLDLLGKAWDKLTGDVQRAHPPTPTAAFGPTDVSPSLYDELAGARHFGLVLTSGYRPGAVTKHGTPSDHGVYPSKAIDVAGSSGQMASFFRWLVGQSDVKQAFYDPLGSIFGGVLSSYREGGHSDHVHVATYDQGGWLMPGVTLATNNTGQPERVGGPGDVYITVNAPNYVGDKRDLQDAIRVAAKDALRNTGRSLV